jgi:phosphatidylinositol-bisphosphatase
VHGSTTLDTRRPAAYTDRVLYKVAESSTESTADAGIVKTGVYTSHEILWSDHRPVSCTFDVSVRIPDEAKRKAELAIARSELDKLDEEWAPAIEVDNKELEFGDVR